MGILYTDKRLALDKRQKNSSHNNNNNNHTYTEIGQINFGFLIACTSKHNNATGYWIGVEIHRETITTTTTATSTQHKFQWPKD